MSKGRELVLRCKISRTSPMSLTSQGYHPDMIRELCEELDLAPDGESQAARSESSTPSMYLASSAPPSGRSTPVVAQPAAESASSASEALRKAALASLKRKAAQISTSDLTEERKPSKSPTAPIAAASNGSVSAPALAATAAQSTTPVPSTLVSPSFEEIDNMISAIGLRQQLLERKVRSVSPSPISAARPFNVEDRSSAPSPGTATPSSIPPVDAPLSAPLLPRRQIRSYADNLGATGSGSAPTGEVDFDAPLPTLDGQNGSEANDSFDRAKSPAIDAASQPPQRKRLRPSAADLNSQSELALAAALQASAAANAQSSFSNVVQQRTQRYVMDISDAEDDDDDISDEEEGSDEDENDEDEHSARMNRSHSSIQSQARRRGARHPTDGWSSLRKETQALLYEIKAGQKLEVAAQHLNNHANASMVPVNHIQAPSSQAVESARLGENQISQLEAKEKAIREMQQRILLLEQKRKAAAAAGLTPTAPMSRPSTAELEARRSPLPSPGIVSTSAFPALVAPASTAAEPEARDQSSRNNDVGASASSVAKPAPLPVAAPGKRGLIVTDDGNDDSPVAALLARTVANPLVSIRNNQPPSASASSHADPSRSIPSQTPLTPTAPKRASLARASVPQRARSYVSPKSPGG